MPTARLRVMRAILAFTVLAATGVAAADGIVTLQRGDSIQIAGRTVYCIPSYAHSDGVTLAAGDSITVGDRRVTCDAGYQTPPPPPPAQPRIDVASRVDTVCMQDLYNKVSGKLAGEDPIRFAEACRTIPVGRSCRITASAADDTCFQTLYNMVSGKFSADMAPRVQDACKQLTASCAAAPVTVSSRVDTTCFQRLYNATSGKPSVATALGWLRSCRSVPVDRCTIAAGRFDDTCVATLYNAVSGKLTPQEAADAARACRIVDARCD
jgi:hypothetical protein